MQLARDQDGGLAALERVGDVGGHQAGQCGTALDVPLDEEHASLVVGGDVADGDVPSDALANDDALLAVGELVASELALFACGGHDAAFGWWLQRALLPLPLTSSSRTAV